MHACVHCQMQCATVSSNASMHCHVGHEVAPIAEQSRLHQASQHAYLMLHASAYVLHHRYVGHLTMLCELSVLGSFVGRQHSDG